MIDGLAAPASDRPEIALLSETIVQHPDQPVNYLLRGEARLSAGEKDLAAADFLIARDLAARRFAQSAWGYLAQAYHDRALVGLAECGRVVPVGGGSVSEG